MWLKKIKCKKFQYIMMTVILAVASMIFSASIGFTQEVLAVAKDFYSENNMPDMAMWTKAGAYDAIFIDEIINDHISMSVCYSGKEVNSIIKLNGKTHGSKAVIFPLENITGIALKMTIKEGNKTLHAPREGEIWIPYAYAELNGINLNDILTLGDRGDFRVSALYITALTSTFNDYFPYYINTTDFEKLSDCTGQELILLNLRHGDDFKFMAAIAEFDSLILGGNRRETMYDDNTKTTRIAGNVSIVAAFIMFIAALFISLYVVRSNLQKELKNIGVYKSLGFSNSKIIAIYFWGYLAIGLIASIAGVLLGLPLIYLMSVPAVKYFTIFNLSKISIVYSILSIAILTSITALALLIILRKIKKIKPIETINMGLRSNAKKLKKSVIKSAHSPLSIAVNEIFKYRASSILAIIMIVLSVFMSYSFSSIGHSMSFLDQKTGIYFGIPDGDAYILNNNALQSEIAAHPDVESVVTYRNIQSKLIIEGSHSIVDMTFSVYAADNFETRVTGMQCVEGREPKTTDEVAIHTYILEKTSFKVNDYVKIGFDGQPLKTYLIVGSFETMFSNYNSIRILESEEIIGMEQVSVLSVKLKKDISLAEFKDSMEAGYGIFAYETIPTVKQSADLVNGVIETPIHIMIAIFTGFSVLIIVNLLFMNYLDNKKSFGTLKTLGRTTKYIALKNLCKTLILSGTGLFTGLVLGGTLAPIIYGFVAYTTVSGFEFSVSLPFIIVGVLVLLVSAITLFFAIPISKIKPIILMEE